MASTIKKQEDGTIELSITIPSSIVKKAWEEVVLDFVKNAEMPGFRKGKAPRKLVEEKIDKTKVQEEILKKLLPKYYLEAVKEHDLRPILNPKIHVDPDRIGVEKIENPSASFDSARDKSSGQADWQFTALTCEAPKISLGNYKETIQKITAKSKIIVPGKEPFDIARDKQAEPNFEEIIKAFLDNVSGSIPKILLEQEVQRLLAQLLDEVKKLGLTLDQYLASTQKTADSIRKDYEQKAQNDIELEFALQKVSEAENITVSPNEIEEAIQKAKDENERKNLENNRYLLANILRQQKTLDYLRNL